MKYTVWTHDDATCDDIKVFDGTLSECRTYIDGDDDEFYILAPDGYTVID